MGGAVAAMKVAQWTPGPIPIPIPIPIPVGRAGLICDFVRGCEFILRAPSKAGVAGEKSVVIRTTIRRWNRGDP